MKSNHPGLFRTRVAQRMMGLLLFCALVPIMALGVTSYLHFTDQLQDQARQRLETGNRDAAMELMERLHFVETELARIAATLNTSASARQLELSLAAVPPSGILAIGLVAPDGHVALLGDPLAPVVLTPTQRHHLSIGKSVLLIQGSPQPDILLAKAVDAVDGRHGTLWATLDPEYMWNTAGDRQRLPPGTEMCVYASDGVALTCPRMARTMMAAADPDPQMAGTWHWEAYGEEYLTATGLVRLGLEYAAPSLTIVLGESRSKVMAPMEDFRRTFPLVLLLATMIVLGVSHVQVRRSMEPLRALTDATGRIARQEFDTHVTIASDDEFEDLAGSFNAMAYRLGRQFSTLTAMSDIDRAALSHSDRQQMVRTVLDRMDHALGCSSVALLLKTNQEQQDGWSVLRLRHAQWSECPSTMNSKEMAELESHLETLEVGAGQTRDFLWPWSSAAAAKLILPLARTNTLIGLVVLEYDDPDTMAAEQRAGRQLADQVAIALANASLLEDLDALSSGALTALARTIDANSPWTAGHSERVTHVSLLVGERLGLSAGDLDTLYRGGLLHDIGKIAIPAAILNKPGALTDEEFAVVKQHPSTGARILSPIGAYQDTIPVVLSHHERLDGSGYPQGIKGNQIPLLARVAAVADVYDALSSARPYRPGWPVERVMEHITAGAGIQFDAAVTEALVRSVEAGVIGAGRNSTPSPSDLREESLGNSAVPVAAYAPQLAPIADC